MNRTVVHSAPPLEGSHPGDVIAWAAERFACRLTCAIGLGVEDVVLISLAVERGVKLDFFSLDTGVLFPESYALWKRLEAKYGIAIHAVTPVESIDRLWETQADRCCRLRKVEPLKRHLKGYDAWVTGIRRDQSKDRSGAQLVESDPKFGLTKVNPLVTWTTKDLWKYVHAHEVPYNPLHDRGYPSIGCAPCTSPVAAGEDPRAGRWRGTDKTECGLHSKEGT